MTPRSAGAQRPIQSIAFVVPGEPVPKARPRVPRSGHAYTAPRTVEAEKRIQQYLKVNYPALRPVDGPFGVSVTFHVKNTGRGDVDNYLKLVLDALTGCCWFNDRQVRIVRGEMFDFDAHPVTMITVYQIPVEP